MQSPEGSIEYREIKPYWRQRLARIEVPFELRLINGMQQRAPEVTVRINRVVENRTDGVYELHIGRVIGFRNWDPRLRLPK